MTKAIVLGGSRGIGKAISDSLALFPDDLDLIVTLGSIDDEEAHLLAQEELGVAAMLTTRGAALEEPKNNEQTKENQGIT